MDRKLFKEELMWYSRYQIVEEMYLNDCSEDEIYRILLEEVKGNWTAEEITRDLEIIKSY